jgi:hypothetical protein
MTAPRHDLAAQHGKGQAHGQGPGRGNVRGHAWMMIACCIPMLVIAVILVATGVASPAFQAVAVGCTLMMALMMGGMSHGGGDDKS